ncbi:MAG: hypothetical protein H6512_11580 [Acidimicrobiia bacterium]|nr:hypothetical protein [Acidimicrobiia bacterium]
MSATVDAGVSGVLVNNAEISSDGGDDEDSTPGADINNDATVDRESLTDLDIDVETGDEDDGYRARRCRTRQRQRLWPDNYDGSG